MASYTDRVYDCILLLIQIESMCVSKLPFISSKWDGHEGFLGEVMYMRVILILQH